MNDELIYTLRVWITALLIGPILVVGYWFHGFINMISALMAFIPFSVFFGGMFSIPSVCALWLAVYLTRKYSDLSITRMRLLWTAISIPLSVAPSLFFGGLNWAEGGYIAISYASVIIAAIWFYKLIPEPTSPEGTEES